MLLTAVTVWAGEYTFNSQTGTLTLVSGEFNSSNKWGNDVSPTAVKKVVATNQVMLHWRLLGAVQWLQELHEYLFGQCQHQHSHQHEQYVQWLRWSHYARNLELEHLQCHQYEQYVLRLPYAPLA